MMRSVLGASCHLGLFSVVESMPHKFSDELFCPKGTCLEYVPHDFAGPPSMFWECQHLDNRKKADPVSVWSFSEGQGRKDDLLRTQHHQSKCEGGVGMRMEWDGSSPNGAHSLPTWYGKGAGGKGRQDWWNEPVILGRPTDTPFGAKNGKGELLKGAKPLQLKGAIKPTSEPGKGLKPATGRIQPEPLMPLIVKGKGRMPGKGRPGKGRPDSKAGKKGKGAMSGKSGEAMSGKGEFYNSTTVKTCDRVEGKTFEATSYTNFIGTSTMCQMACEGDQKCTCYVYDASKGRDATTGRCDLKEGECGALVGTSASGNMVSGNCSMPVVAQTGSVTYVDSVHYHEILEGVGIIHPPTIMITPHPTTSPASVPESEAVKYCDGVEWGEVNMAQNFKKTPTDSAEICKVLCKLEKRCQCWSWGNFGNAGEKGSCSLKKGQCHIGCKRKAKKDQLFHAGVCKPVQSESPMKCDKPKIKDSKNRKGKGRPRFQARKYQMQGR